MSVILYGSGKDEPIQQMADAYASLKHLLRYDDSKSEKRDQEFYSSLGYLYFANVAAWLATYHDDCTPLPGSELATIEPSWDITGKRLASYSFGPKDNLKQLHVLISAWGSLNYNLVTNGGEMYKPVKAYEFVEVMIQRLTRAVIEGAVPEAA